MIGGTFIWIVATVESNPSAVVMTLILNSIDSGIIKSTKSIRAKNIYIFFTLTATNAKQNKMLWYEN